MKKPSLLNQSIGAPLASEGVGLSTMPQCPQPGIARPGGGATLAPFSLTEFVRVTNLRIVTRTLRSKIDGTLKTVIVTELSPAERSMLRLKAKLRANTDTWKTMKGFLTLTYADESLATQNDLREFLNTLKMTMKRKTGRNLQYVWKTEWGTKRGRLHYHIIFDKFIPKSFLKKWKHGMTEVKRIKNPRMAKYYVSKYITKLTKKANWWSGRLWSTSRGWSAPPPTEWEQIATKLGKVLVPLDGAHGYFGEIST